MERPGEKGCREKAGKAENQEGARKVAEKRGGWYQAGARVGTGRKPSTRDKLHACDERTTEAENREAAKKIETGRQSKRGEKDDALRGAALPPDEGPGEKDGTPRGVALSRDDKELRGRGEKDGAPRGAALPLGEKDSTLRGVALSRDGERGQRAKETNDDYDYDERAQFFEGILLKAMRSGGREQMRCPCTRELNSHLLGDWG